MQSNKDGKCAFEDAFEDKQHCFIHRHY